MGQRRIDSRSEGDGSKTNRLAKRRRWVKDESTQEMVRCGFFAWFQRNHTKRKVKLTRMVSKKPQLGFKERLASLGFKEKARCGFFETKREAKDMNPLPGFQIKEAEEWTWETDRRPFFWLAFFKKRQTFYVV